MWKLYVLLFGIFLYGCGCSDRYATENNEKQDALQNIHMFGDSIFATLNHRIKSLLENKIGQKIADHSQTGKWAWEVKNQYIANRNQKPQIIVMDGGGNDILGTSWDCKRFTEKCKNVVKNAANNIEATFKLMAEDGVKHILFMGCHYTRNQNSGYDPVVDYSYTTFLFPICSASKVPCQIVDPREKIKAASNSLEWDGVHPNQVGTQILADLIFEKLSVLAAKTISEDN